MRKIGKKLSQPQEKQEKSCMKNITAKRNKVFVDSSILIAATLSHAGGSFYILTELKDEFVFKINDYVFEEILRILDTKFGSKPEFKTELFLIIGLANIEILKNSSLAQVKKAEKFINKDDAPILAGATENCSCLLTLDNHFLTENILKFAIKNNFNILKPKDFIEQYRNYK